jgi:hypothetical protein
MRGHDLSRDGEAEPGPRALGGEERLEDARSVGGRNARPGIGIELTVVAASEISPPAGVASAALVSRSTSTCVRRLSI